MAQKKGKEDKYTLWELKSTSTEKQSDYQDLQELIERAELKISFLECECNELCEKKKTCFSLVMQTQLQSNSTPGKHI